jgi:hypothetical protein
MVVFGDADNLYPTSLAAEFPNQFPEALSPVQFLLIFVSLTNRNGGSKTLGRSDKPVRTVESLIGPLASSIGD